MIIGKLTLKSVAAFIFAPVCLACGCAGGYQDRDISYSDDEQRDEYKVYSRSIENVYLDNLLCPFNRNGTATPTCIRFTQLHPEKLNSGQTAVLPDQPGGCR